MTVEVDSKADGLLVLSQVSYPGWRARVDGEDASPMTVDHLLMAVPVGEGEHTVEVTYDPGNFRLGLVVSVAAALAVIGLILGVIVTSWRAGR